MSRVIAIILTLVLLAVSVTACGNSSDARQTTETATVNKTNNYASPATTIKTTPAATSQATTIPPGTESGSTGTANIGLAAKLPAKYPKEAFPIFEGSHILSVIEAGNSYTVVAYSKANYKDVIAFYENLLKKAQVTAETRLDTSYTSFGTKDGFTYNLNVASNNEYKGYQTSIAIMIY